MGYGVKNLGHFDLSEALNVSSFSTNTLNSMLSAVADIQMTVDAQGGVSGAEMNTELSQLLEADKLSTDDWRDLIADRDKETAEAVLKAARSAPGDTHRVDLDLYTGSQDECIPVSCWFCSDEGTKATKVVCKDLRSDASVRQQLINAQRTLEQDYWSNRRLEARYRRMLDMISDGFLVIDDLGGRVLEANKNASVLLGLGEDSIVGRAFPFGLSDEASRTIIELQKDSRSVNGIVSSQFTTMDGNTLTACMICLRQSNETRLLLRISPIKHYTSELTIPRDAFEHAPDGILVTDNTGVVVTANTAYLKLAGINEEYQAIGRRADRWLGRSNVDLSVILDNVGIDTPLQLFSTVLRTESGALIDVELSAAKTQINGQTMIISFIRDISRRIDRQYETEVHLPRSIEQITGRVGRVPLKQLVRESTDVIEALCVEAALKLTKDNRAAASELLGLSRQSLYTKLRRFDIGDSEDEVA